MSVNHNMAHDDKDEESLPNSKREIRRSDQDHEDWNLRGKEQDWGVITGHIDELRKILCRGGIGVPDGADESTILNETASYIRSLQQQVMMLESNVASYNMEHCSDFIHHNEEHHTMLSSSTDALAIASIGGAFLDCNTEFTQLSSYSKHELQAMNIFNLIKKVDLHLAFVMTSQLITPPKGKLDKTQAPILLRSSFKHRQDICLNISLCQGNNGVKRHFLVKLIVTCCKLRQPGHPIYKPKPYRPSPCLNEYDSTSSACPDDNKHCEIPLAARNFKPPLIHTPILTQDAAEEEPCREVSEGSDSKNWADKRD